MTRIAKKVRIAAALGVALLAGCQEPDVGQQCTIDLNLEVDGVPLDRTNTPGHFIQSGGGAAGCDHLICVLSRDPDRRIEHDPYCSKPCVSDDECSPDETGLRCLRIAPDETLLAQLTEEQRQQYVGGNASAFYCALPPP